MWWWLAGAGLVAAGIAFVQSLTAAQLGAVTLVRAAIVLAPTGPGPDAVFGPIVDRPQLARGLIGHLAIPVSLGFFLSLAAAPVVGNTTALMLKHGTGYTATWTELYPGPGRWLIGAALFAVVAAHAATHVALDMHLRGWNLVRNTGWLWWAGALPGLALFAWAWRSITGADALTAAVALAAMSLALAWTANRAVWSCYTEMGFAPPTVTAAGATNRSRVAARLGTWLLILTGAALAALVRGLDIGAYGTGPGIALLTPAVILVATVVKGLIGDVGEATARRHGLPFHRD
ncbi:hypothetical protein [Glycomyces algeriensis]|uniref:Uncharacterized protein n=1 Tax=Glycomyces algeriensis TaxID=256037 RepID=A0A9W6LGW4_9ACTN|nr:hypothetical protein [Glycomyces algeriensis]MDA1364671.1 hypothetical protein [Glycomyces algeriensis]MDR7350711.1 hypothetical protein [Glycomyces algeriensis]GLI43422.1 hypothetical protein GALLR39Z86_32720 [Glycomyces algeriensis]